VGDLSSLLLAAIEEAERLARSASAETEAEWSPGGDLSDGVSTVVTGAPVVGGPYGHLAEVVREHIARHDPASVLRRCAADRKIVEFWSLAYSKFSDFPHPEWDRIRSNARWTIRKIAEAYGIADHEEG
jgi:hypothetical protein